VLLDNCGKSYNTASSRIINVYPKVVRLLGCGVSAASAGLAWRASFAGLVLRSELPASTSLIDVARQSDDAACSVPAASATARSTRLRTRRVAFVAVRSRWVGVRLRHGRARRGLRIGIGGRLPCLRKSDTGNRKKRGCRQHWNIKSFHFLHLHPECNPPSSDKDVKANCLG
jgi:hypothetical protein